MRSVLVLLLAALWLPQVGAPAVSDRVWAKPDHFWWRQAVAGGHVWLTVDAKHGAKAPLFDHQRLATELNQRGGYAFTALTLPFADPAAHFTVKYDGSNDHILEGGLVVEFGLDGEPWRCDLQLEWDWTRGSDYECSPGSAGSTGSTGSTGSVRVSPDGKWEAVVVKHNVAVRPAGGGTVKMLTSDGKDGDAYDPGSLRWSADSRTLSAYRLNAAIWSSDSVRANVRHLVAYRELTPAR